ncbi:MAG: radical SAM protein [Elusimicrobia bacterium]|nr:radical SAM protein [Elusimicrobiota bacterium]
MTRGPDRLAIYITNRCNLACRRCFVAANRGPKARLDPADLKRAVAGFLNSSGDGKTISFLGGEPLLEFRSLLSAARLARRRSRTAVLQVFTNGTLLTPRRLRALRELDAQVTIGLEIPARDIPRLKGLLKRGLGANLVVHPDTADRLLEDLDRCHRAGFGRINFTPGVRERWTAPRLRELALALKAVRFYYRKVLTAGLRPFSIPALFPLLDGRSSWRRCPTLTLGPDGSYYACDKTLRRPALRIGTAASGPDWARRETLFAAAAADIVARGFPRWEGCCPLGAYFHGDSLDDLRRLSRVYFRGLSGILSDNRRLPVFQRLHPRP